jgi:hypothetical protein
LSKKKRRSRPNIPEVTLRRFGSEEGSASASTGTDYGFNPDYSYVIKDLKRIGVLAAGFIILLVLLSLILG